MGKHIRKYHSFLHNAYFRAAAMACQDEFSNPNRSGPPMCKSCSCASTVFLSCHNRRRHGCDSRRKRRC